MKTRPFHHELLLCPEEMDSRAFETRRSGEWGVSDRKIEGNLGRLDIESAKGPLALHVHMEFDRTTTALAFLVLLALIVGGTVLSPMRASTVAMVSVGLFVFGSVSLVIGVKHGEYRARDTR